MSQITYWLSTALFARTIFCCASRSGLGRRTMLASIAALR